MQILHQTGSEEGVIYKHRAQTQIGQRSFFPRILDDLAINQYLLPKEKENINQMFQDVKKKIKTIIKQVNVYKKEQKLRH